MEGGRSTRGASDRDKFKGAGAGVSRHTEQHGHSGVDVSESRAMEGGGRARRASDGDEEEGTRPGASRHANGIRSSKN